jgi:site-specific DNA recombinase
VRIATYTRISTDEVNQPYSLGAQSERLASYVASQADWELVGTFTDQMSGAKLERPGLQGALRAARAGRFDLLLVYRVDRLARSVRGLAEVLETLDSAGVGFRSATEPFDTTSPAGRMMVQMLGVFAEFERATIIDRVIAGMERKSSQGGWCGGTQPFGYRAVKGEGRLEVDEDEAPLIPVIFDLYANKRLGSRAIANQLSASGLTTRSGRPWQFKSILTVLRNRTYLGQVNFRGVWTDGDHPPLVEQGLFDTAQAILAERGEDVAKRASNSSDYLLTGLVVCGNCGSHFTGTRATGRNATYRYYTCGGRQRYGTKSCAVDRLQAEALDDAVLNSLLAAYEDTDLFGKAVAEAQQRADLDESPHDAERAALQAELDKVERGIDRYLQAFESGTMPEEVCGERVKALGANATALRARMFDLDSGTTEAELVAPTTAELGDLRKRVEEAVADGSSALVKSLLQALIHEIRVDSRQAIHPIFRVPVGGAHQQDDAVRAPSRSVEVKGLEPSASTLRTERCNLPGLGFPVDSQATLVGEVHRGARKGTVGQQLSPVESRARHWHGRFGQANQTFHRRLVTMARTRSLTLGPAARPVAIPEAFDWEPTATGTITLPLHVRWSDPVVAYDMAVRNDRIRVYEQVLREGTEADVRHYVDPEELAGVLNELVLPPTVRRTWEEWFRRHNEARAEC